MSNLVFPPEGHSLEGKLAWSNTKEPMLGTLIQRSGTGRESRIRQEIFPRWKFIIEFKALYDDVPNGDQLNAMMGFFLLHGGGFETFRYMDTQDYHLEDQQIGFGDGALSTFQIHRTLAGLSVEPIYEIKSDTLNVYHHPAGFKTLTTNYTESKGLLTFSVLPTGPILVTCDFYFRVRFENDSLTFEQLINQIWAIGEIELVSVKP